MAIPTMQNLLNERKYPFILLLFILLIVLTFFLISNSQSPIYIPSAEIVSAWSNSEPSSPNTSTLPISNPLVITASPRNDEGVPINDTISTTTTTVDDDFEWKLCEGTGAVDYVPCLDNWKAIKALQSRRHMEHRERYCPKPSPRCLVPLPLGYKVPVPWPKSRDMVR